MFADLLDAVGTMFRQIVDASLARTPETPRNVALAAALMALVAVLAPPVWPRARHAITIAHEGGHALLALATGRRLTSIRLHSDSSGVTVSSGRTRGLGMILTCFAGYPAPALLGLGGAFLVHLGYLTAVLWILVALLIAMLWRIRGGFGLFAMVVVIAGLVAISWWGDAAIRGFGAIVISWFLFLGAVRPIFELQRQRMRGRARNSDVDQLATITRIPALVWLGAQLAIAVACLVIGGGWMLAPALGTFELTLPDI